MITMRYCVLQIPHEIVVFIYYMMTIIKCCCMGCFNIKNKIVYKLIQDEYGMYCYSSLNQKAIGNTIIPLSIDSADAFNEFLFGRDVFYINKTDLFFN